jgi:hypothetical protein
MISHLARTAFIALLTVGFAGSAQAALAELFLSDCDAMGCEGSTLYLAVDEGEVAGTWEVTYTINTTNYTGGLAGFNQIGFKVIKDWDVGMVTSSPAGSEPIDGGGGGDPYDPWNPVFEAPIHSNSLCDANGGNTSKVCIAGFVDIREGGNYTWTFLITGGTLMDVSEWHLGAQYAGGPNRAAGHIISAQVPEPTAAVLFGLGAILVTRRARRR